MKRFHFQTNTSCKWIFIIILTTALQSYAGQLHDGLTFRVTFDETLSATHHYGMGDSITKMPHAFSVGLYQQGISINENGVPVTWRVPGNLNPDSGTIAFWYNPTWSIGEITRKKTNMFLFSSGAMHIYVDSENRILVFASGGYDENENWKWDYSVSSSIQWEKSEWHHVAITWKKNSPTEGQKKLYIDGQEVSSVVSERLPRNYSSHSQFYMGGRQDKISSACGIYDDLMIWNRALDGSEITRLANRESQFIPPKQKRCTTRPITISFAVPFSSSYVLQPGQLAEFKFNLTCDSEFLKKYNKVQLRYEISNFRDDVILMPLLAEKEISFHKSNDVSATLKVTPGQFGVFRVTVYVLHKGSIIAHKDAVTFAVINTSLDGHDTGRRFGVHVVPEQLSIASQLGLRYVRSLDMIQTTWWQNVQPKPGYFVWDDNLVSRLKKLNMSMLGVFFRTPMWAVTNHVTKKASPATPPSLDKFASYVEACITHYKGFINAWEVWNEPHVPQFWRGTPEQYVKLLRCAYETAKLHDSGVCIIGGGGIAWSARVWAEEIFKLGALEYMDAFSIHSYLRHEDIPDRLVGYVRGYRKLMKKYHKSSLPIWNTECGVWSTTFFRDLDFRELPELSARTPKLNYQQAAEDIVKASVTYLAEGVEKIIAYYMRAKLPERYIHRAYNDYNFSEFNGAPKPLAVAYGTTAFLLDHAVPCGIYRTKIIEMNVFRRGKTYIAVLWGRNGAKLKLTISPKLKALELIDIMGNIRQINRGETLMITGEPVFIKTSRYSSENMVALLKKSQIELTSKPKKDATLNENSIEPFLATRETVDKQWQVVDLCEFINRSLIDDAAGDGLGGWTDEGSLNDMRDFPLGKQHFHGVPFEIIKNSKNNCNVVITRCSTLASLPRKIGPIPIACRAKTLYFLHTGFGNAKNIVGQYEIKYSDGTVEKIELYADSNISDWWKGKMQGSSVKAVKIRVKKSLNMDRMNRYLQVLEWNNPHPEKTIRSITLSGKSREMSIILFAISLIKN